MSVNLHLGVIVRDYRADRADAIEQAVRAILVDEEIDEDLPPLTEVVEPDGHSLESRTDPESPVIISRAYEWAPRVEEALRDAVLAANGGPCRFEFIWEDADEGKAEEEDDED